MSWKAASAAVAVVAPAPEYGLVVEEAAEAAEATAKTGMRVYVRDTQRQHVSVELCNPIHMAGVKRMTTDTDEVHALVTYGSTPLKDTKSDKQDDQPYMGCE